MKTLDQPTLVLNRCWQPIGVITVARALVTVWNERARVVDPHNYQTFDWEDWSALTPSEIDPVIRTGSGVVRAPEVIVLIRYDRVPSRRIPFSRSNLFRRDRETCQYCGERPGRSKLTIDHIVPRSQGGGSTWENCVSACSRCNTRKANRTPNQAGMPLNEQPVRPRWSVHFTADHGPMESWSQFLRHT